MSELVAAFSARFDRMEELLHRIGVGGPAAAPAPAEEPESYTTKAFAQAIGKAEYTVREWCRQGRINCEKLGRHYRIPGSERARYDADGLLPEQGDD